MRQINNYINYLISFKTDIDHYFKVDKEEIAERNLLLLRISTGFLVFLVTVFILITPFLIPEWCVTREYIAFLVVGIIFFVFLKFYSKKEKTSTKTIQFLSVSFLVVSIFFVIILSTFPYPDKTSTLFVLCFMTVPNLLILKPCMIWGILFFSEIAYVIIVSVFKTPEIVSYDIFTSVAATVFAFIITIITTTLRVHENSARMKYQELSKRDLLTTLLNKKTTERYCERYLQAYGQEESSALFIIDLDNFKNINDYFGHKHGDEVLVQVGEKLNHIFHEGDIKGRIGGDEFLVLMKGISDKRILHKKATQVITQLSTIFSDLIISGITCSIGISIVNKEKITFSKLYSQADQALYKAKDQGKKCFMVYQDLSEAEDRSKKYLLIVDQMEASRTRLRTCFQEQYNILEADNGKSAVKIMHQYAEQLVAVILDVDLPVINGLEVLRIINKDENMNKIPVLVISSSMENNAKALKLGATNLIHKPFEPVLVKKVLKNSIE